MPTKDWYKRHKRDQKAYHKRYWEDNKEILKQKEKLYRFNLKLDVIKRLGGCCACCGECHPTFMTLDHIHGGGYKQRVKDNFSRTTSYNRVKMEGFPRDKYRILCWNCNAAIGLFGGCPHDQKI